MNGRSWRDVLAKARAIVAEYQETGVTLRQLYYRLVADGTLANTRSEYSQLSEKTAAARRRGEFPSLIDRTRTIHRQLAFDDADDAQEWLFSIYRHDRSEGQPHSIYLGVEKAGIVEQLRLWFGDLGLPVLALGGYSSQSYVDEIRADAECLGRPAILIYGGDFDPSGEDIERDFVERCNCFVDVERIALTVQQVADFDLPRQPGKASDTRAGGFVARHGRLMQVELGALPPDVLRSLYANAVEVFFDVSIWRAACDREAQERARLAS
jgi:hypothetical protein